MTFRLDDCFPTYRVVRCDPGRLVLRGDSWPEREFHAWPEDVLGRAIARRRDGVWLSRDDPAWRRLRLLALGRYRAALVRRQLRCAARGPYAVLRRMVTGSVSWVCVDATDPGSSDVLAAVREARTTGPAVRLDVRMRAVDLTPAIAAELASPEVSRVVVTVAATDEGPRALQGAAALSAHRRARGTRMPVIRIEYSLDPSSYGRLVPVVREAAAAGVEELALTGPGFDKVVASDGGARLKQAVKLAEAFRIGLGRVTPGQADGPRLGPDHLAEILS